MIERPASRELDAILETVEKIREAEAGLRDLKARVAAQAQALAGITDKRARIEAGFYAYWFAPEVNATDIAMGATGRPHPGRLLKLAGPVSLGIPCDRCGEDMPVRSRAQMKEMLERQGDSRRWPEGYRMLCMPCQEAVLEGRAREDEEEELQRRRRQRELAAMPYLEYLATEDWEEMKASHLWWHAHERYSLECEPCGAKQGLGVYHRTLEGLGGNDDLVVVCNQCRDALMAVGKLAGEPSQLNEVPATEVRRVLESVHAELT